MEKKSPEEGSGPRLKCNICGCLTVLDYVSNDFVVPAPNVDNSYSFTCEQCNKDSPSGQPLFEHRSKTWLELVATATFNTARLSHSQYVKVGDIVHYLEEHQQKLNLNLTRVDKNVFRQRVNVTLCRNPKLFETAAKGSGSYRLNENYHAKPHKRVFSYVFEQSSVIPEPATPPQTDNISFESVESFLLQNNEHVFVKTEDDPAEHSKKSIDEYEILEFLSTNNHTRHATHPPMMITNNNIIFPRWDQPLTLSTTPLEPGADFKNELLQLMLQVSSDPQSLGIVPNQALSSPSSSAGAHFSHISYIDYHTVLCEACERPSETDDERFILGRFMLLPGPQDKNYVFTCRSCTGDVPTMVHKIKNRLEFTSSVLYTLQQSQGQSIFTMKDVSQ